MRQSPWPLIASLLLLAALPRVAAADEATFRQKVGPIFASRCLACHHGEHAKGGLSLASREGFLNGGESGAAIVPGDPDKSLLVEYIAGEKPEMPKEGAASSADEVALVRDWIAVAPPGRPTSCSKTPSERDPIGGPFSQSSGPLCPR